MVIGDRGRSSLYAILVLTLIISFQYVWQCTYKNFNSHGNYFVITEYEYF